MAAVAAWGAILAAGAYWYVDPRVMRISPATAALIILACTAAFVGFWWMLLAARSARLRRAPPVPNEPSSPVD
jgi:hypothetical protein